MNNRLADLEEKPNRLEDLTFIPTEPLLQQGEKNVDDILNMADMAELPISDIENLYEPMSAVFDAVPDPKDVTIGPVEVPIEKEEVPMRFEVAEPKRGIFEKFFGFRYPPKPPDWDYASPIEKFNFITLPISDVLGRIGGKIASDWRLTTKEDVQKTLAHELSEDLEWYQKTPEAIGWTAEKVAEYLLLKWIFKASGLHRVLTVTGQKMAAPFMAKEITARGGLKTVSTLSAAGIKNLTRKALTFFLTAAPENVVFISSWSALDAFLGYPATQKLLNESEKIIKQYKEESTLWSKKIAQDPRVAESAKYKTFLEQYNKVLEQHKAIPKDYKEAIRGGAKSGAGWGLVLTAGMSVLAPIARIPELKMAWSRAMASLAKKYPRALDIIGKDVPKEIEKEWLKNANTYFGKDVRLIDLSVRERAAFRNAIRAAEKELIKAFKHEQAMKTYWSTGARMAKEAAKTAEKAIEKVKPVEVGEKAKPLAKVVPPAAEVELQPPSLAKTLDEIKIEGQKEPDVLVEMPAEKPSRKIVPAKGKKKAVIDASDKENIITFTDFGNGIAAKGKTLYHLATQQAMATFESVQAARRAATTLAEETAINWKDKNWEKTKEQFNEWLKEKGLYGKPDEILAFLTGKGKELDIEDYVKSFSITALKKIDYSLDKAVKTIAGRIKSFAKTVPEFTLNPTFTFDKESGQLVFKDRYRFGFHPDYLGFSAEDLKDGQTIRFNLSSFNIKPATTAALKKAEAFLGEPELLGRTTEKPIPVERYGVERKPRKLTAKEETYIRALSDIETGMLVDVEGGVTIRQVAEDDIRRVAELGRKAERQGWTVERDILLKQEKGTAESKVAFGDTIRIVRDVFAAQPPTEAEVIEIERPDEKVIAIFSKYKKAMPNATEQEVVEALIEDGLRPPKDMLKKYEELPSVQRILEQDEIDKAVKRAAEAKPPTVEPREPQQLYDELVAKWGDDAVTEAQGILADENETYQEIDAKFFDLDSEGKGGTEQAKALERQLLGMVDDYLSRQPKVPTEEPSLFVPEPAENLSKVVVDKFRDWPESIKKVGKDFWTEIMAAAKEVLTPFRYKALRRTILGAFRYKKAPAKPVDIELQDIRDVLTTTHELGHNIDWLLNHKSYPKSIKDRFDVVAESLDKEIKERALRNELKKVSRILRPDLWLARGGKGKPYVNHHTELMADFISGYILDPEQIKELAPTMTELLEKRLGIEPKLQELIKHLQDVRYEGPKEPPIARTIREQLRMPPELKPLQLHIDLSNEDYVKAAEQLGVTASRQYKMLMNRAKRQAQRIDKLVPDKLRQTDLVVIAEKGEKNPWTGKTTEEILKENPLTEDEKKALSLYRSYQELARQTVNKYLRGSDIAEYISFIEDYFIHTYQTPMTQKYRGAIAKWAKRSPQAKKRVLPDLATAVEIGLTPRAKTLSEGLKLWAGINYRVATNKAFLSELPKIVNENGESILQKPQDKPDWPTVDYWPIRKHYAIPLPDRGILLHEGRVAVDPKLKPFVDAMFGYMFTSRPAYVLAAVNAVEKAFQLTVFSAFHHIAEFFSTVGGVGEKILGVWGKSAKPFEDTLRTKLAVHLPAVGPFYAGSQLKQTGEFMEDYLAHGGQTGYITGEGIGLIDKMLGDLRHYFERLMVSQKLTDKALWIPYLPVKTLQQAHHAWQRFLWGTIVENGKLFTYYDCVQDSLKWSDKAQRKVQKEIDEVSEKAIQAKTRGDKTQAQKYNKQLEKLYGRKRDIPSVDRIKEMVAQYINNNYGGQEWLNTMFRNPKFRWTFFQIFRSWDWTYGQLKTPLYLTGRGLKARTKAERELFRLRGRRHWLWYLLGVFSATEGLQYALNRKFTWQNEPGHRFDVDYTKVWRFKDELKSKILGTPNWKERGDNARRYTVFGKAGREVLYWFREPLTEFGRKLSPIAQTIMEQFTGYNIGSDFAEPWKTQDLELYEELWERAKNVGEKVIPFSFRGNNAFLALPLRKGMTRWKAVRAYQDIYSAKAKIAYESKFNIALLKAGRIADKPLLLFANEDKLRKDIIEACKVNKIDAIKAEHIALSNVKSIYYGNLSRAANNREIEECNKYARALIELGVKPENLIQSIRSRGIYLTPGGRQIEVEAYQKALKEYFEKFEKQAQNK